MGSRDTGLPLTVLLSTEMVLVTACLIVKWIHQALFISEEQKTGKRRTFKPRAIPGKHRNYPKEPCQFNKTKELLDKELESVKAVLDIRNEDLKRLREELELLRREVREVKQEHKGTQTRDDCGDVRHSDELQDERGRSNISL